MACRKCGSDWVTATGRDCNRCPHCDKQQLCMARKAGRWVEPVQVKQCVECGRDFEAVGPKRIKQQIRCGSQECLNRANARKIRNWNRKRRTGVVCEKPPERQIRFCKRESCGKQLTDRNQKHYCSRSCAGADARDCKRDFAGMTKEVRLAIKLAEFFHDWELQRPEWVACEACGKQIEQCRNGQRRVCDDKCRYRLEKPLVANCIDCGNPNDSTTRYHKRCVRCRVARRRLARRGLNSIRRRCKKFGVEYASGVTAKKIFERDGYRCQLCKRKCLSQFRWVDGRPHALSPTVDHIVPLSMRVKGHVWDNVQCACWACNVAKGARAKGQIRMACVA